MKQLGELFKTNEIMTPQFRILKNKDGKFEVYYVEKVKTFFGIKLKEVLKPYITWSGLEKVYPFNSIDVAILELKQEVIKNTERI